MGSSKSKMAWMSGAWEIWLGRCGVRYTIEISLADAVPIFCGFQLANAAGSRYSSIRIQGSCRKRFAVEPRGRSSCRHDKSQVHKF